MRVVLALLLSSAAILLAACGTMTADREPSTLPAGEAAPASFFAPGLTVALATESGGHEAGIYNCAFESPSFYLPMPIPTVKISSLGCAIDDFLAGSELRRHDSCARPRIPMPDTAIAALAPGRC